MGNVVIDSKFKKIAIW